MTKDKDSRRKRLEKKTKDKERPRRTKRPKPYERLKGGEDKWLMKGV